VYRVLIYIPIWKRPEITEICFSGLDRIRTHRDKTEVLAVISEDSYKSRCKAHDIEWTFFENRLGAKKNHGLRVAMTKEWDYLIELNSDDLLKNELLDIYDTKFGKSHFFGLRNFCFLDSKTGRMRHHWNNTIFGIGRTYSRQAVERSMIDGKLWNDDATAGMDNYSWRLFDQAGYKGEQILTDEPMAVDIKSDVNIWAYNPDLGVPYDLDRFMIGLSDKEIDLLNGVINSNTAQVMAGDVG